jgi:hypothetical protein
MKAFALVVMLGACPIGGVALAANAIPAQQQALLQTGSGGP